MQNNYVAIVGSGVSGISASIELIKKNIKHTVFEARNLVGGRFYSFYDPKLNTEIDNGQHLFSPAYRHFFEILEYLGTINQINKPRKLEVYFCSENNQKFCLEEKWFKGKLGLLNGIIHLKSLKSLSKIKIILLLNKLAQKKHYNLSNLSTYQFLLNENQNFEIIKKFWQPICISIFNNSIENIPASLFLKTIKIAFFSELNTSGFQYSNVPQSKLLKNYEKILSGQGSRCLFNNPVVSINKQNGYFCVSTKNSEEYYFDNVIICVPPNVLKKILPIEWVQNSDFQFLNNVNFNPILSGYFTTSQLIFRESYVFLLDSPIHWIFNRNVMTETNLPQNFYSFTTSNAKSLINYSDLEIIELLKFEIQKFFNIKVEILNFKIIRDKHATVDINLEFQQIRPQQETSVEGLYLAGDWTNTELPATLESAALSGKLAVELMLNKRGVR